ncbi:hypothetical protein HanXRQr2_Chr08g0361451 [Helianthus annuus]|uniref:Uncharacterized protein n=1 Tax=Helianthus annuus TaxID=4232 RepID=A0A251U8Q7_HELAN|nr:hypothetical protein HanXRQr2_Chr08g0361451 [Helianthus annuus]KAJ0903414.1 hypothetical protein HanPSC8_Chr08g0348761 [Helianthus annuus]
MVYEAEYGIYDDALRFYYTKLRLGSLPKDYYANQLKKWKMMLRGGDYGLCDCCRNRVVVHHQILEESDQIGP